MDRRAEEGVGGWRVRWWPPSGSSSGPPVPGQPKSYQAPALYLGTPYSRAVEPGTTHMPPAHTGFRAVLHSLTCSHALPRPCYLRIVHLPNPQLIMLRPAGLPRPRLPLSPERPCRSGLPAARRPLLGRRERGKRNTECLSSSHPPSLVERHVHAGCPISIVPVVTGMRRDPPPLPSLPPAGRRGSNKAHT